jgi:Fe-S cluster biogenesis protein NfuA
MEKKVKEILEKEIKPMLEADGGSIELVSVDADGVVKVKLQGACSCCPSANMTLQMGVERVLKNKVPGVKKVIGV